MNYYSLMLESYKKHQEHPEDAKAFYDFLYYAMMASKVECAFSCGNHSEYHQNPVEVTDGTIRIFGHTYKERD